MKGRFWGLWTVGTAVAALAAMVLWAFPAREPSAVTEHLPPAVHTLLPDNQRGRVNLNTADMEELMTLPGIGRAKAAAIIEYRTDKGPFRYPEELVYVPGIGEGMLAELMDFVTTGGG